MSKPLCLTLLTAALVAGCAGNPVETAQQAVAEQIPFSEELQYREVQRYPDRVVCGQYRVVQRWGDYSPYRHFVYRDGVVDEKPSGRDVAIYCSENRLDSLYRETGIRIDDESRAHLVKVARDLRALHDALEAFYVDTGMYPDAGHGLAILVSNPHDDLRLRNYREGGYLATLPRDPWGQDYYYAPPEFAGSRQPPTLLSLGADGRQGGLDANTDIGLEHLHYLEYLLD
ncbi:type II secretion system protein GspG [Haliea atlantica]